MLIQSVDSKIYVILWRSCIFLHVSFRLFFLADVDPVGAAVALLPLLVPVAAALAVVVVVMATAVAILLLVANLEL